MSEKQTVARKHPSQQNGRKKKPAKLYFRQPCLSSDGSEIAFHFGGDIWIVSAEGGHARRITAHEDYDYYPLFSPDDKKLAFASDRTGGGNIYLADLQNANPPERLTFLNGSGPADCWSPDGKWIYFSSDYNGLGQAIYKISVDGGTPICLHSDPMEWHHSPAVSPDGQWIAFNNNGDGWWRNGQNSAEISDIWLMPNVVDPREFRQLNNYRGKNLKPMWRQDGTGLFFLSDRSGIENIWEMPLSGDQKARRVTRFRSGRVVRPNISANGKWMVFERDFSIWRLNLESGESEAVDIRVQVDEKENSHYHFVAMGRISENQLSPDGKKVAFVVKGNIFADVANKSSKGVSSVQVTGDHSRESQLSWHPDSKNIVYISDRDGFNQIFLYDFTTRVEKQLTDSLVQKYFPKISPDKKYISYVRESSDICLIDIESGEERVFIRDQLFLDLPYLVDYTWSPDSQWIAFVGWGPQYFSNVYVQHLKDDSPQQITFLSNISCEDLLWSPNGRYIVFSTGHYRSESQIARVDLQKVLPVFKEDEFDKLFQLPEKEKEEAPAKSEDGEDEEKAEQSDDSPENASEPASPDEAENDAPDKKTDKDSDKKITIEFEGIKHRLQFLTDRDSFAYPLAIRPNSKTLIYSASILGKPYLWSMSMDTSKKRGQPCQLTYSVTDASDVSFSPDGKKLFYVDSGSLYSIVLNDSGDRKSGPSQIRIRADIEVDFHQEKMQAFNEAWTLIRDHFYDAEFHGCDWDKVYQTFEPLVRGAQTSVAFQEILRMMLGELNASHLGAYGGWLGPYAQDSYIGLLFDQKELAEKGVFKITRVLPNAPVTLVKAPAREGEYLVAIEGQPLDGKSGNYARLMKRRRNRRLKLLLNDTPVLEGAREIVVQPVGYGKHRQLQYRDWVNRNGEYVTRESKGKVGYVHIPSMSYKDYMKFIADLDSEAHNRDGIIIDIRYNGGGHIAAFILDVLYRKSFTRFSLRGRGYSAGTNFTGGRILEKPLTLITNEQTASDAEIFSEGFRRLGLGKVIGQPTAGAVIYTSSWQLLDGTRFRLPRFLVRTMEGENTELSPRPVDIAVARDLGETASGMDSQLDVAVETLLKAIRKERRRKR